MRSILDQRGGVSGLQSPLESLAAIEGWILGVV